MKFTVGLIIFAILALSVNYSAAQTAGVSVSSPLTGLFAPVLNLLSRVLDVLRGLISRDVPAPKPVNGGGCAAQAACSCILLYAPVCGSDGKTYGNSCQLGCAALCDKSLKQAYTGECKPVASPCICPAIYAPVCGTDGKTYSSQCNFNCENKPDSPVKIAYTGECKPAGATQSTAAPCTCTFDYTPVCGTDGKTYGNQCQFDCENKADSPVKVAYNGECQPASGVTQSTAAPCVCTAIYAPVCGTDGKTYASQCVFDCENKPDSSVKVDYTGECKDVTINCACPDNYLPVCGSNGQTYGNECEFKCAKDNVDATLAMVEGACAQTQQSK